MLDPHVIAVVVTFNRAQLLGSVIDAVSQQTRPVDEIVVVDNASTDETPRVIGDRERRMELVHLVQQANIGGAGGFAAGMEEAMSRGADWMWIMDDDVVPQQDCLEELLRASPQSELLTPVRVAPDGSEIAMEWMVDPLTFTRSVLPNSTLHNGNPITFVLTGCFEGALISRRIVDIVGVPDSDYFIAHDDTVYGMKAAIHTNVCLVAKARMRRLLDTAPPSPWKSYFLLRNMYYLSRDIRQFYNVELTRSQRIVAAFQRMMRIADLLRGGAAYVVPIARAIRDGRRYLRTGKKPTRVHYP